MIGGYMMETFNLFHVTKKINVESILRDGLLPSMSDYTKRCWVAGRLSDDYGIEDDYEDECRKSFEDLDFENEEDCKEFFKGKTAELEGRAGKVLRNVVFATATPEKAIVMVSDDPKRDDIAVMGIKTECEDRFHKEKIGDVDDYVSYDPIPPACLDVIDPASWK